MILLWHCRGCNQAGKQDISIDKLNWDKTKTVLEYFISLIDHECSNKDIGIKAGQ